MKFGPKPAFLHPYHLSGRELAQIQPPTLTLDPKLIKFYAEVLNLCIETIGLPQMCNPGKGHQFPLLGWGLADLMYGRRIFLRTIQYTVRHYKNLFLQIGEYQSFTPNGSSLPLNHSYFQALHIIHSIRKKARQVGERRQRRRKVGKAHQHCQCNACMPVCARACCVYMCVCTSVCICMHECVYLCPCACI